MATIFSDTRTAIADDAVTPGLTTLYEGMYFLVDVTTATAGTLDIEVEWSLDDDTWVSASTPDAFAQITTTPGQFWLGPVSAKAAFYRVIYTVVTGPYTFDIAGIGF